MFVRLCVSLCVAPLLLGIAAAHATTPRGFDVLHYDVALVPDIANKRVTGQQTLQFQAGQVLRTLTLDSGALNVTAVDAG